MKQFNVVIFYSISLSLQFLIIFPLVFLLPYMRHGFKVFQWSSLLFYADELSVLILWKPFQNTFLLHSHSVTLSDCHQELYFRKISLPFIKGNNLKTWRVNEASRYLRSILNLVKTQELYQSKIRHVPFWKYVKLIEIVYKV